MTISGERTEQLDIFRRITGFMSDFLSFIDVELIRFFHGALQFMFPQFLSFQYSFRGSVFFFRFLVKFLGRLNKVAVVDVQVFQ